jgi:transcriptional regulator with XRE-family HTH domain
MSEIGKRVRELREARGLSQSEVARRAGITPSAVHFIESGRTKEPSASTVAAIARAIGVGVEEVFEESAVPLGEGLPAWALTSDMNTFSQRVSRLSVDDLKRLAENLISGERILTLEDLPLPREEERDTRVMNFARAMVMDDEFQERGVAPPPRFTVAYRRHLDALAPPPDAESRRDADHGSFEAG